MVKKMKICDGTAPIYVDDIDLTFWSYGYYIVTAPIDCMDEGNADIEEDNPCVKWEDVAKVLEDDETTP